VPSDQAKTVGVVTGIIGLAFASFGGGYAVGHSAATHSEPTSTSRAADNPLEPTITHVSSTSLDELKGDQAFGGIAFDGRDYTAVGWYANEPEPGETELGGYAPRVWRSRNGLSWNLVSFRETHPNSDPFSRRMEGIVYARDKFIAVGDDWSSDSSGDAAVWSSTDGERWEQVAPSTELGGDGYQWMGGVTYAQGRFVAVGGARPPNGSSDPAVWTSEDGLSWRRLHDPSLVLEGSQRFTDILFAEGRWIAVGIDTSTDPGTNIPFSGSGDWDAAVWTSRNAISWELNRTDVAARGGPGGQTFNAIAHDPARKLYLAVGADDSVDKADAAFWTSLDGVSWKRISQNERELGGSGVQQAEGVIFDGKRWVVVGKDTSTDPDRYGNPSVWLVEIKQ
jgi:hypothetical protein